MQFPFRTLLELFVFFYVYDFIIGFHWNPIISSFHSARRFKIKVLNAEENELLKSDGYYEIQEKIEMDEINSEVKSYSEIIWWDLFRSSPAVPTPSTAISKDVIFRNLRQIKDDTTSPLHSFDVLQGDTNDIRENVNSYKSSLKGTTIPSLGAWRKLFSDDIETASENINDSPPSSASESESSISQPPSLKEYLSGDYSLSDIHQTKINELWENIKNKGSIRNLNESDCKLVKEALGVAYLTLWGRYTARTLEAAINRAAGIAAVLGEELNAPINVILAGILHEVIATLNLTSQLRTDTESTETGVVPSEPDKQSISALENIFGQDVIDLSESYSQLPRFLARKADYTPVLAENLMQMLVLYAEDYLTLYIRLADRLHTMRVLNKLPLDDSEKLKVAQEALFVYAPLAHKMGVMKVKGELEDLSFKVLEPDLFQLTLQTQLAASIAYNDAVEKVQELKRTIEQESNGTFKIHFTHRIKDKYQLSRKMIRKKLQSPSDVRDALGLRIIVEPVFPTVEGDHQMNAYMKELYENKSIELCYVLTDKLRKMPGWAPTPSGFKDYIRDIQKASGYKSIHQYIRHVALNTNVEVQVRTKEMHIQAELGEAAHWYYKDMLYREEIAKWKVYRTAWRSNQQLKAKSSADMIRMAKEQIEANRVLIYLEDKSTVLNLKKGSTALDAAFAVHSDVGLSAVTIRINTVSVPFDTPLRMGDVVSVDCAAVNNGGGGGTGAGAGTGTDGLPSRVIMAKLSWLKMVRSTQAQATLRKHLKEDQRRKLISLGLVHLIAAISRNKQTLINTYTTASLYSGFLPTRATKVHLPDAYALAQKVRDRMDLDTLDYFLLLGAAPTAQETALILARLLEIPAKRLVVSSANDSIQWARSQGEWGWKDADIRNNILRPFLFDIFPKLGLENADSLWADTVGSESLAEVTPLAPEYYEGIASTLISKLRGSSNSSSANSSIDREGPLKLQQTFPMRERSVSVVSRSSSAVVMTAPASTFFERRGDDSSDHESSLSYRESLSQYNDDTKKKAMMQRRFSHTTKIFVRSQIEIAQKPFSLEASLLSDPLRALARKQYADYAMARTSSHYDPTTSREREQ